MAIVSKRRVIRVGSSRAVTLPPRWTGLLDGVLEVIVDRVGLIVPPGMPLEEVERDVKKILDEIRRARRAKPPCK